jgi:hypothetical protein
VLRRSRRLRRTTSCSISLPGRAVRHRLEPSEPGRGGTSYLRGNARVVLFRKSWGTSAVIEVTA